MALKRQHKTGEVVNKWHEYRLKLWQRHKKMQYNIVKYLQPHAYGRFFNTAFEIQVRDMHPPPQKASIEWDSRQVTQALQKDKAGYDCIIHRHDLYAFLLFDI